MRSSLSALMVTIGLAISPALAGPPYVTDDPEPTDTGHFEIYAFTAGTTTRDGTGGAGGIDFNYGGARDLQLTATLPLAYDIPRDGSPGVGLAGQDQPQAATGIGNVELAAKYRFLHQDTDGLDVSLFPRLFLPSLSDRVGDRHASLLLPFWAGRNWGDWAAFGGGGCALNNGEGSRDYCLAGVALTRQVLPALNLGAEFYHQTADTRGGKPSTGLGVGAIYDLSETYHLLASYGPGIQNAAETNRFTWYMALEFTF